MKISLEGVEVTGIEAEVCLDIARRQARGREKYPSHSMVIEPWKARVRSAHRGATTFSELRPTAVATPWNQG
jgi:hypothetical protein